MSTFIVHTLSAANNISIAFNSWGPSELYFLSVYILLCINILSYLWIAIAVPSLMGVFLNTFSFRDSNMLWLSSTFYVKWKWIAFIIFTGFLPFMLYLITSSINLFFPFVSSWLGILRVLFTYTVLLIIKWLLLSDLESIFCIISVWYSFSDLLVHSCSWSVLLPFY